MSTIQLPSPNKLGTRFGRQLGYTLNNGFHYGLDILPGSDMGVYLPEDGQVGTVFGNGNEGNVLYLWAENRKHALCHLERFLVQPGFHRRGEKVGVMGYTGHVEPEGPKGCHLHYAVQVDGFYVDPLSLIGGRGAADEPMTRQEAVAIVDAFFGRFTERKVKDTELEEYVQALMAGQPDKLFSKAVVWDEVQRTIARRAGGQLPLDIEINGVRYAPKGQ